MFFQANAKATQWADSTAEPNPNAKGDATKVKTAIGTHSMTIWAFVL